ncbi:MBL fold metallo-hydrolase [Chitinimonas sp. BJYL2]|uniref:MBL fold metallo-hydrolase n=1 Tax=Chitinimonas sp. BJYL2 TaxID=2976696 RepID=UPI0022B2E0C5|nr:MBL fold metallo-hydrolase [Chitinimonas sp. BJYL2]
MPHRLAYPLLEQTPAVGEALPVADGIFWLKMPLPFALNHINLWLIKEDGGWTVVDAGYDSDDTRAAWQQVFAGPMAGKPILRHVATHYHPDHIGLAAWLCKQFEAPFHISLGEYLLAKSVWHDLPGFDVPSFNAHFARHGLPQDKLDQFTQRGNTYHWGVKQLPPGFHRLIADDQITLGGARWRCIPGYGHSPEHMALYCEERGVLISGDMLLPKISTNVGAWAADPDGDPLGHFLASLDRFLPLPAYTLVLPSHGRPFRGIHPRVEMLKAHHTERLDALLTAASTPQSAFELMPVLFGRMFDLYQTMFAMAECIAHLNYLWHRGELVRERDALGVYRFCKA